VRAVNAVIGIVEEKRAPLRLGDDQGVEAALRALAGRLNPQDAARVASALIRVLDGFQHATPSKRGFGGLNLEEVRLGVVLEGVKAVAPSLTPRQAAGVFETLIGLKLSPLFWPGQQFLGGQIRGNEVASAIVARLGKIETTWIEERLIATPESPLAFEMLTALAPRMEPRQAARAWEAIIRSSNQMEESAHQTALRALASRLHPAAVKKAADEDIALLEKSTDNSSARRALVELIALVPRVDSTQINRIVEVLDAKKLAENAYEQDIVAEVLTAVSSRVEPTHIRRVWDALFFIYGNGSDNVDTNGVVRGLTALAPRLQPQDLESIADQFVMRLGRFQTDKSAWDIQGGLIALSACLKSAVAARAVDAILARTTDKNLAGIGPAAFTGENVFAAFAPLLHQSQIERAAQAVVDAVDQDMPNWEAQTAESLAGLLPRFDQALTVRVGDGLLRLLEKPITEASGMALDGAIGGLIVLAPRLESAQVSRGWEVLLRLSEKQPHAAPNTKHTPWDGLAALLPRIELASRDKEAIAVTSVLLDYSCSDSEVCSVEQFAGFISSPRSLAKLLSHPGCVGEQREALLRRFEELALYDGEPIFSKRRASDEKKPALAAGALTARRFHTLHDAAAWIQQNWPDFDLETNCPATWRGSR
jgi:hypothetical protein